MKRFLLVSLITCHLSLAASVYAAMLRSEHFHEAQVPDEKGMLEKMEYFHGHLGPYLVLAAKASEIGFRELKTEKGDMNVLLECRIDSPERCMLDGFQTACGATLGQGKIAVLKSDSLRVWMIENKSGVALKMTLSGKAVELLKKLPVYQGKGTDSEEAIADLAREVSELSGSELWEYSLILSK